ncbi:flagellin lysine-N-methylase [Cystobacter fuscus]
MGGVDFPAPMPTELTLPRYMTRFRCIAERCEDTCCAGLKIPVSPSDARRMQPALAAHPAQAEHLRRSAGPESDEGAGQTPFLPMHPDGTCAFLDPQRMCALQRDHGEGALPDVCATFPRVVTARDGHWELSGSLACPEVVRLSLLAEDAMRPESLPFPSPRIPRPEAVRYLSRDPAEGYTFHAESVRAALLRLLDREEHPLATRLALLGQLAYAVDDFYFRGTDAFGEETRTGAEARLSEALQRFDDPEAREAVHREFSRLALPGGPCVGLFTQVVKARMAARGGRVREWGRSVLESLGLGEGGPGDLDAAWSLYTRRWQALNAAQGPRLAQYFHHYVAHFLWRTSFTEFPSLLAYVFRLALRVGLVRLMLVGHPMVVALLEEPSSPQALESLELAVVETVQTVAKHVEQSLEFLSLTEGLVGTGRGAETLGKVLVFASF